VVIFFFQICRYSIGTYESNVNEECVSVCVLAVTVVIVLLFQVCGVNRCKSIRELKFMRMISVCVLAVTVVVVLLFQIYGVNGKLRANRT
jgi:hypothetical protein